MRLRRGGPEPLAGGSALGVRLRGKKRQCLKVIIHKNFGENFFAHGPHPGRTLAPNRFRFFARIARCIAVIGGTGGVPSWWEWGRVSVRVRAVWRGGPHHRRAGALLAEMGNTPLRSRRSTALRPDRAFSGAGDHRRTGFGKKHVNAVRTLMEGRRARGGKVRRAISTTG